MSESRQQMSKQLIETTTITENAEQPPKNTSLCHTLKSRRLWIFLFYGLLLAMFSMMIGIVTPVIGGKFFESSKHSDGNAQFSFWNGISQSVGGILAFLFEGYIGRLSDAYGRKKIMICVWILYILPNLSLLITSYNVWIWLCLSPLSSLSGALGGMPTVLQAAIADITANKNHLTMVYAICFGVAGLFLIIGAVICPLIVDLYGINVLFYIFLIGMIFALLWLIFIIKETLPIHMRKRFSETHGESDRFSSNNPFKVFKHLKTNKVLFWICMITLITSFPENGISDFITSYIDDMLAVTDDDNKATFVNSICEIIFAMVLLVTQLILIPMLFKCFNINNDILMFAIGIMALVLFAVSGMVMYVWRTIYSACLIWIAFGLTYILIPVTNGALASRMDEREQGVSIGVLHAIKGLTSAIAPFVFGLLYDLYSITGDKYEWYKLLPWFVALIFIMISVGVLFGPLKKTLSEFDVQQKENGVVVN
eukprot:74583_1